MISLGPARVNPKQERIVMTKKTNEIPLSAASVLFGPQSAVNLIKLSELKEEKQEWLWKGVLPKKECVVFYGTSGVNKSSAALSLAAIVTTGGDWPVADDKKDRKSNVGNVILITSEDSPTTGIIPRLEASGADLDKVTLFSTVTDEKDGERLFDIGRDIRLLETSIVALGGVDLVIVDPLYGEFIGKTNGNSSTGVRQVLNPLIALARKHNFCILGIMHENKAATKVSNKALGSVAWMGVPRLVFRITEAKDDKSKRTMATAKKNITTSRAYFFTIESARTKKGNNVPKVVWSSETEEIDAQEVEFGETEGKATKATKTWILKQLKEGDVSAKSIYNQALLDGIITDLKSTSTLDRAKAKLGINSKKVGKEWVWVKPAEIA